MIFLYIFLFAGILAPAAEATIRGIDNQNVYSVAMSQISDWSNFSGDALFNKPRLKSDELAITRILRSFGYMDATVTSSSSNNKVFFDVTLNERYKFDEVLLIYVDQRKYRSGLKIGQVFDLINIKYDSYTDTKQISDGREKIKEFIESKGFAFAEVAQPKIKIDRKNKKLKAIYKITLNGKTIIDKTIIKIKSKKDPKLLEPFIKNRIPWNDGDVFDLKKINDMKESLMSTGKFAGIDVILSEPSKDKEDSKICHTTATVDVDEALLRDISAGLKYSSSEKIGILLSWSHYNIDGRGSDISAIVDAAKDTKILRTKYNVYDLFYKRQKLATQVFYLKEDVTAYDVSKIGAESILWQNFMNLFEAGVGVCCEKSKTKDKIDTKHIKFRAIGVPFGVSLDTTDSYLDPQKGLRCSAVCTPYFGNLTNLTVLSGRASLYFPIRKNKFKNAMIVAVYAKAGSIFRNKNHLLPRDKLFFSGGNNSVRAYDYQKLGPLTSNNRPYGGESLFEFGVEPRFRITENVGLVAFFEGGNVFLSKVPKPFKKLLFGYGAGVRYYTPLGPIRVDLAFPTSRRKSPKGKTIDSMFNLYISIGQAF